MPHRAALTALIIACLSTFAVGGVDPALAQKGDATLPDIGSSAGKIITPEEQRQYGQMAFRELRNEHFVLDDPLLEDWLQDIGERLGSYSNRPSQDFHFFIMRSREVNAFATLGGYIAVNAGMLLTAASEDELAAVMSHEIAHVTQNHVLRGVESQTKAEVPIVLGMLAAIVMSTRANTLSSSNAAGAAMASGIGLLAQTQINFTRDNETEADHLGIQTLARAGYDPVAMASAFERIETAYRSDQNYGPYKTPDFLIDHPVTSTRISDALDRARQIKGRPSTTAAVDAARTPDSLLLPAGVSGHTLATSAAPAPAVGHDFGWARERMRVLSAESASLAIAEYQRMRSANPKAFGDAQHYGLAIAMTARGDAGAALAELQDLSRRHPDAWWLDLAIAQAHFEAGQRAAALATYDRVLARMPGNRAVILSYANTLAQVGTADAGRRAQAILRPLADASGDDPEFQHTFARACELAGDTGRAGEAYAVAAFLNGRAEDALNQLEALKQRDDLDYYQRARVEARIEELKPVVLEMRKQGIHAGDSDRRQPFDVGASWH